MTHASTAASSAATATSAGTATVSAFANDDLFGFMDADQQAQFANDDDDGGDKDQVRTRSSGSHDRD